MSAKIPKFVPAFLTGLALTIAAVFLEIVTTPVKTSNTILFYRNYLGCLGDDLILYPRYHAGKIPILNHDLVVLELDPKFGSSNWSRGETKIMSNTFVANTYYLGYALNKIPNPDRTAIIYLRQPGHIGSHEYLFAHMFPHPEKTGSRAVLFANLKVRIPVKAKARIVSQAEWDAIKKRSHIE